MMRCLRTLSAASALVATTPGQHPEPMVGQIDTIRGAIAVEARGDAVVMGGWDHTATIDAAGLDYTPALGERAAATQQLALRPLEFGRGESMLAAAAGRPRVDGVFVEVARGAGITECCEARSDGVAISWRFDGPLQGDGDLVVRYRVETTLPAARADAMGVKFLLPGVGGVSIGAVTGVDAVGRRAAGELRLVDDILELRLPDRFVDDATYPLVLDPLVGTEVLATTNATYNDSAPDAAYDLSNDVYLVVYRRVFSAVSQVVRAQRIQPGGALLGGFLSITPSAVVVNHPCVANLNQRDTFVVAWQEATGLFGDHCIRACSVDAATGAVSADVCLMPNTIGNFLDPDIAGNSSTLADSAFVVYTAEGAGIRLTAVSVPSPGAVPVVTTTTVVTNSPLADWAAISKSSGRRYWMVAYRQGLLLSSQITAQMVSASGALLGSAVAVDSGTLASRPGRVDVDGDGTRFVVAYELGEPGAANGERDLWCRGLTWSIVQLQLQPSTPPTPVDASTWRDQKDPAVGFCRDKFLIAYADQVITGANNYDVRAAEVLSDCTTCGPAMLMTGINGSLLRNVEFAPAIATETSGGADSDRGLIVFTEADHAPPFSSSVVAQRYEAIVGGAVSIVGNACGAGGSIVSGGPFAVGNTDYEVRLQGVPAGGVPFLLFGFVGGEQTCGPCTYVNGIAATFVPATAGVATYPWPLPCSTAPFVGTRFQLQWAILNSGQTPCAALPTVSFSDRLTITLGF